MLSVRIQGAIAGIMFIITLSCISLQLSDTSSNKVSPVLSQGEPHSQRAPTWKSGRTNYSSFKSIGMCADGSTLRDTWVSYDGNHKFDRWLDYADHYNVLLPSANNILGKIKMLEIGVQSGGSAKAWKRCYRDKLEYVGIDIDPRCMRSENTSENIHIQIGSQLNTTFLESVCSQFGPFDVVIDDGGHTGNMIETSLAAIFSSDACMGKDSIYAVEDTHTMARCEDAKNTKYCSSPKDISFLPCEANEKMHSLWFQNHNQYSWADKVVAVHMFDSISFYLRGEKRKLTKISRGRDSFSSDYA
jgi:hypothetical protein